MNKHSLQIALAYMSVVIGGGFASGNEVLQFFTGYGLAGIAGSVVAAVLFAFLGMQIARISSIMQAGSHKQVLYIIFGKQAGFVVDLILSFFLYGVGVVMLAGAGSTLAQQFGLDPLIGSILMTVLVIGTLCLNVKGIINLISSVMPFLLVMVLAIMVYSIVTSTGSVDELNRVAAEVPVITFLGADVPHWALSGLLYASFNIAVGFPMLAVIGGLTASPRAAGRGGVAGGLGLGFLIILLNIGLFANLDKLQGIEIPTLMLAQDIHPWLAVLLSLALVAMIYSTAVGMFFAFSARFAVPDTVRFKVLSAIFAVVGLALSQVGFTKLVGTVYPMLGVVGLVLIIAIAASWIRTRKRSADELIREAKNRI
ncbi:hypothetical protein BN1049_02870 [Pseudomonas saudimassiliensis]|uniref:Membrane protein YkvI n=1 Tax=Pseudomonas saudimassiliensis TaxID=1461581 RepID=A0A078MM29_9PSED|nr:membrane protein [Pseudomonas saudimassiliensis]CEA06482.1 hypothetical protein BN1049_02870 [Pseudomonas saudimassiliensis]CEF27907.1 hypothetical protein BN1049_02870 [Pseudomonas saudimassiliensis]